MKKTNTSKWILALLLCWSLPALACTLPKSYYKNVACTSQQGVFLATRDNNTPVALLNQKGNKTTDLFAYDGALGTHMAHGLLPVRKGQKIGYINSKGKVVIPIKYDSLGAKDFARKPSNSRIIVKLNGSFGVIDTKGNVIVDFDKSISNISDFKNNRATITKGARQYTIDQNGAIVSQNDSNQSPSLSQEPIGLQSSQTQFSNQSQDVRFIPHLENGKWGFVDDNDVLMIIHAFDEVHSFSEGLAGVRQGTHWGFIDKSGTLVIPFRFDDAGILKNNSDKPEMTEPFTFINNKAWIGNLNDGTKLCINTQGVNISC